MPRRFKISTFHNMVIGLVFVLAALIIIFLVNASMKQAALREAESKARLILDRNLATHTYFSRDLKPKLFTLTDPFRPVRYFEPAWMSSTYAVREIDRYSKSLATSEYYYKECAVNARTPENEADEYERAFIHDLNRDPKLVQRSELRTFSGRPYFVVLRRGEALEESCLRCHSTPKRAPGDLVARYGRERSFQRQLGEVISAISIRIPLAVAYADANRFSLVLSAMLLTVLSIVFTIKVLVSKRLIFTPLAGIRDKALQISADEARLGEEIRAPAAQELYDLTTAFNAMSKKLRSDRDHLEELVEQRTKDLQDALDNVKTLRGMLPICASCKKVRNDDGYWSQIEVFIRDHSDADFSHGLCPDCATKLYPRYYGKEKNN